MADNDEQEPTPAQDIVVTKYKMTGDMVNGKLMIRNIIHEPNQNILFIKIVV